MQDNAQPQKIWGNRAPGNPREPLLRAGFDEYATFCDLLCYLPGSEKPFSLEANDGAPRAMFYIPEQHLFHVPTLHKCTLLATCLSSLTSPSSLHFPLFRIASLPGRMESLLSGKGLRDRKFQKLHVAFGLWTSHGHTQGDQAENYCEVSSLAVDVAPSSWVSNNVCDHGKSATFCSGSSVTPRGLSSRFFALFLPKASPHFILPSLLIGKMGHWTVAKAKIHTGSKTNAINAKLLNCTTQTDRTPFACCFCLENFKETVNTGARYPQKWKKKRQGNCGCYSNQKWT